MGMVRIQDLNSQPGQPLQLSAPQGQQGQGSWGDLRFFSVRALVPLPPPPIPAQ